MNSVSIYGGLGNQMFQYAFYNALKSKGKKSSLSFSSYLYYGHHNGIDLFRAFKIKLPFIQMVLKFVLLNVEWLYNNKIGKAFFKRLITWYQSKLNTYQEKEEFKYDENVFKQSNTYFVGTWQNISYLNGIETILKNDFKFNIPTDIENAIQIEKIKEVNSVSIHVRRGDYLNAHWIDKLCVIKDVSYYQNAVDYINQKISNPYFFIFSDDVEWVKQNLKISNSTYINNNQLKRSYVDMYLMSICKHNIIANSTFSWWAAWLNNNKDKIVIMPNKWMNNNSCEGIFSKDWIKIECN